MAVLIGLFGFALLAAGRRGYRPLQNMLSLTTILVKRLAGR
jgi:hypothetical protein